MCVVGNAYAFSNTSLCPPIARRCFFFCCVLHFLFFLETWIEKKKCIWTLKVTVINDHTVFIMTKRANVAKKKQFFSHPIHPKMFLNSQEKKQRVVSTRYRYNTAFHYTDAERSKKQKQLSYKQLQTNDEHERIKKINSRVKLIRTYSFKQLFFSKNINGNSIV